MPPGFDPRRVGEDLDRGVGASPAFDPRKVGADLDDPVAPPPDDSDWMDVLGNLAAGATDGLFLKNASLVPGAEDMRDAVREIGDLVSDRHEIGGMKPEYAGERDPDLESLYELANETPEGKIAGAIGEGTTGALATLAAPASVPAQAAVGLGLGALTAGGDTDWRDPGAITGGGLTGAALGAGGALLGKLGSIGANQLRGPAKNAASGAASRLDEILSKLDPDIWEQKLGDYLRDRVKKTAAPILASRPVMEGAPRALAGAAAANSGAFAPEAQAQDMPLVPEIGGAQIKAYAGMPATTWATKQALSEGTAGLSQADTERLTRVIVSGDEDRLKAENFKLSQRYPEYARKLQTALSALNDDEGM